MLDESAVGLNMHERFSYSWRDIILYHLSVGAQQEELDYVYEKNLKVLPSFGVIPASATFGTDPYHENVVMPISVIKGLRTDGSLHMDSKLFIYKPIPTGATLDIEKVISAVYDRGEGKGAKINVDLIARDREGEKLFSTTMGYLNRWYGGFGGPPVPHSDIRIPDREPDYSMDGKFPMNANLLYRLTGDTYNLHVDPDFAKKAGFNGPIIHGLCSLGYACRMMISALIPGEPERVTSLENQFRTVAYPGEAFCVNVWRTADGEAVFRMVKLSDGKPILDYGRMRWKTV